jgi:hypothetical protein
MYTNSQNHTLYTFFLPSISKSTEGIIKQKKTKKERKKERKRKKENDKYCIKIEKPYPAPIHFLR